VDRIDLPAEVVHALALHVVLYYTGRTRRAASVLADQVANVGRTTDHLHALKEAVGPGRQALLDCDMRALGGLLHRSWEHKKRLSDRIHDDDLDGIYERALRAGAYGGKLLGAGGGGFFVFICPPARRCELRRALAELRELPFRLEPRGSRVVLSLPDQA
jgi:D-glycero-alpha-D-manno-heptose-7-phosphate kinase